jgi:23S rRNA (guanine745-N1)-methyltransferase
VAARHSAHLNSLPVAFIMDYFRCPLCALPLRQNSQGVACDNLHQFDRAKEGYLNLLPVQHKHSKEPGDAKLQLQARRHFLQAGYFAPLQQVLCHLIPSGCQRLLDIGCGEGFFTTAIAHHGCAAQVLGIDIAKSGVRMAARSAQQQSLDIGYAVASSHALPFMDQSMDVITRIYAPSKDEELVRVLKPQGLLLLVVPGERHLLNVRTQIYQQVRPHEQPATPKGFRLLDKYQVCEKLEVNAGEDARALLEMTPFAWHMNESLKQESMNQGLNDWMHFEFYLYTRE